MAKKILLADDSLTIQKVVELTFSDGDYELVAVSNGQKALDRLRDDRPDLVLADVVMPEKNGYEVCEAIKSDPATARIPVVLLSGTFEPFDRERAERIGADAIVSKPFDSQQLIAQVDALLDRAPSSRGQAEPEAVTAKIPVPPPESLSPEAEEAPFDVGFSAEDFTAAVRMPPRGLDPFEEEYGRGDVDSAIEAFERSHPHPATREVVPQMSAVPEPPATTVEEAGREPVAGWLGEEPEKIAEAPPFPREEEPKRGVAVSEKEEPAAIPAPPSEELVRPEPLDEVSQQSLPMELSAAAALDVEIEESAVQEEKEEKAVGQEEQEAGVVEAPAAPSEPTAAPEPPPSAEVPHEIEMLAQTSSIPELTQMLSTVAKSAGAELTDEQVEKLARRVVEKLSDRVVREIAWEVIPDMAEIVIKQRIKELEAGVE